MSILPTTKIYLVMFTGSKGSGKDTAATMFGSPIFQAGLPIAEPGYHNFATALKLSVSTLFNIPLFYLNDPEAKEKLVSDITELSNFDFLRGKKIRNVLQEYGQSLRDIFPGIWPEIWYKRILTTLRQLTENPIGKCLVIPVTDMRYPDELGFLQSLKATPGFQVLHVHIVRDEIEKARQAGIAANDPAWLHESERYQDLMLENADEIIYNNSDLVALSEQITKLSKERIYHVD